LPLCVTQILSKGYHMSQTIFSQIMDFIPKYKLVDKIALLQAKIEDLEKSRAILEESGKKHLSPTDPDASLMKSREGMIHAYNVQAVVDLENKMIADAVVSINPNDLNELSPVMYSLNANLGVEPEEVLADNKKFTIHNDVLKDRMAEYYL